MGQPHGDARGWSRLGWLSISAYCTLLAHCGPSAGEASPLERWTDADLSLLPDSTATLFDASIDNDGATPLLDGASAFDTRKVEDASPDALADGTEEASGEVQPREDSAGDSPLDAEVANESGEDSGGVAPRSDAPTDGSFAADSDASVDGSVATSSDVPIESAVSAARDTSTDDLSSLDGSQGAPSDGANVMENDAFDAADQDGQQAPSLVDATLEASSDGADGASEIDSSPAAPARCMATAPPALLDPVPSPLWSGSFHSPSALAASGIALEVASGDTDTGQYVEGRSGAVSYRPRGTYLKIPASTVLHPQNGSIAVWIGNEGFSPLSATEPITLYDTTNARNAAGIETGWAMSLKRAPLADRNNLRATFTIGNPDATDLTKTNPFVTSYVDAPLTEWAAGQWHHIVVTWGGTTIRLYVDGKLARESSSQVIPQTIPVGTTFYLLSSKRAVPFQRASGGLRVDSMTSYGSELSLSQVETLFRTGVSTGPTVRSSGDCLAIELAGPTDGFGMRQVYDAEDGAAKSLGIPPRKLWQLTLRSLDGKETYVDNTATILSPPSRSATDEGLGAALRWGDIPLPDSTGAFGTQFVSVTYNLFPTDTNAIGVKLSASLSSTSVWAIHEARVLRLDGLEPMGAPEEDAHLVLPDRSVGRSLAGLFALATPWPLGSENIYPGRDMGMQWFGVATNSPVHRGLFVAAYDPTASTKAFRFARQPASATSGRLQAEVALFAEHATTPGNGFEMTWPVVVSLQAGSWYDHARRYRGFASTAPWTPAPLGSRTGVPTWMKNGGLLNQGASSTESLTLAGHLSSYGAPDGLVVWHHTQWDVINKQTNKQFNDTPFLTPLPTLSSTVAQARAASIPVALYFNPDACDAADDTGTSPTPWTAANGSSMAVRQVDGSVTMTNDLTVYNPNVVGPGQHHAYMCPASQGWRNLVDSKLQSLVAEYDIQGFYLDQVGALRPRLCYSETHGHPVGGGHHWVDGQRSILTSLRSHFGANQGIYIEGFAEPYVDVADGFLTWDAAVTGAVPLAQVVYHERAQFLGRAIEISQDGQTGAAASAAKQAELLTWGGMPGFHSVALSAVPLAPFREYLFSLARARRLLTPYLVEGELLASIELTLRSDAATGTAPTAGALAATTALPTQSIDSVDMDNTKGTWTGPVVLHSVWKGSNGKTLVLLASSEWAGQTRVVQVALPASFGSIAVATATSISHLAEASTALGTVALPAFVRVEVPPRAVVALELSPSGQVP